jgi:hypothetical protein
MFQLTDAVLERIIFAMENQSNEMFIDLETGDCINAPGPTERYVKPPSWDSRRGFAILEAFAATVASPPELKLTLNAALRRGKGVFKAFRQALSTDAALFQRFQDFKLRAMRPIVEAWLDSLLEAQKLEKLKEEPEDIGDIVASEVEFKVLPINEAPFHLDTFLNSYAEERFASMPPLLRARSISRLFETLQRAQDSTFVSFATIDGTHPLVFGIFVQQSFRGRPLCSVEAVLGSRESAMLSLEWSLLDVISSYTSKAGTTLMILEGPLFPPPISEEATAHGFVQIGSVLYKTL